MFRVSGFWFQSLTLNSKRKTRNGFSLRTLLLTFFLLSPLVLGAALQVPPLRGRVNDYAGLMPPERVRALEDRLARFEQETGHQIAVLTIPSLEGEPLEDFSIRVAENWKIGQKGFDNGVILLIARDDRKVRIEVGYGLEGVLPDAIASRIIREIIVPRFRANDYAGGIEAGIDAILKITSGEPLPESRRAQKEMGGFSLAQLFFILLLAAIPIIAVLGTQSQNRAVGSWSGRRRGGGWGGPFWGGFGGGFGGGGGGFSGGGGGFGGGGASGGW